MSNLAPLRSAVLALLIIVALVSISWSVSRNDDWEGLLLNLGTEMGGAALTYGLFELIVGLRESREADKRASIAKKENLIAQLGSSVRDVAIAAAEELRRYGWLDDGSLRAAALRGANLPDVNLSGAVLDEANLSAAYLYGANLIKTSLRNTRLSKANLRSANLSEANLKCADLTAANLQDAGGLSDAQLAEAFSLLGATMVGGQRYNGRFNLEGDLVMAHDFMKVGHSDEAMARFYGVSVEAYRRGQEWSHYVQSPPLMYSQDLERWSQIMGSPDSGGEQTIVSSAINQVLAFLPKAERRSTIYVFAEECKGTWSVAVEDKRGDRIPFWTGLLEDPAPILQQYITANPNQQLQMGVFIPTRRFP
jgi:hypothetical protein